MGEPGSDDIAPKRTASSHDALIPPWQDMATLCKHISCSADTVESWVADGILPPPRNRGGKLMWKWSEVDDYLTHGGHQAADINRIREATRRIVEGTPMGDTPTSKHHATASPTPHELLKDIQSLVEGTAKSHTLFVTDEELIERLGVPDELARALLLDFDGKHPTFPKKQEQWGDRRYWPAVKAWLDETCGNGPTPRPPRKSSRSKRR
jgi:hypothetical protein